MKVRLRAVVGALAWSTVSAVAMLSTAEACDLCSIYTATVMQEHKTGPWVAVSEQFTSFNTLRDGDKTLANENAEWLQSSITQLVVGYSIHPRFGLQLNVPLISREFRRFHDGAIEHDDESGLGDISLVGRLNMWERVTGRGITRLDILAGLKFPTGDADRLAEEIEHEEEEEEARTDHTVASVEGPRDHHEGHDHELSGVHGHDLALGTGSLDLIVGFTTFTSWRRVFFEASVQYLVRGHGDFGYDYANDLLWSGGPGMFVWLGHQGTAALEAAFSGESKDKDEQFHETADDTAITALYLGPRAIVTFSDKLNAELGAEWPLVQEVSSVQLVPDYRLRAGLTWKF
jgi:hypothetical protein